MMDVDDDVQAGGERICDQVVGFGKNGGREFELRPGPGVMMPGNRQPDMVKSLRANVDKILTGVLLAPILPRRRFQVIAEVSASEELLRRPMRRCIAAGQPPHLALIGGGGLSRSGRHNQPCGEERKSWGKSHEVDYSARARGV